MRPPTNFNAQVCCGLAGPGQVVSPTDLVLLEVVLGFRGS